VLLPSRAPNGMAVKSKRAGKSESLLQVSG
jgi:hypothetical protein